LLDIIEERLDETELIKWSYPDQKFGFIRSQIIIFNTQKTVSTPAELAAEIPNMPLSSIFYHFIDARRRTHNSKDDFCCWLEGFNGKYQNLINGIANIDPYFSTLNEIRQELS